LHLARPAGPRFFGPAERLRYRAMGVDPRCEQTWVEYTIAVVLFSAFSLLVTYVIQRLQRHLPLNPNPTKLLEVVEVGKQLLMTRGTLTNFSIANDVAKYRTLSPEDSLMGRGFKARRAR
jgi:Potassium-transporting ATPase A subunit